MSTSPHHDPRLRRFPPVLRELLEAELAAGNAIVEVASCFPAPPAGAYAKLEKMISTRARERTPALEFYDRNTSIYSGEWTDAKRFYFVLEPPRPPPPEPDMDAIREAVNRASAPLPFPRAESSAATSVRRSDGSERSLVRRFEASMAIDYEKWHDGIGYDLTLIVQAGPDERQAIERLLLARNAQDWRDVEALAVLKTERAEAALRAAFAKGNAEIRGAVLRHAPHLVPEEKRRAHLIAALRTAEFYGGLSQALDDVARYHPREIIDELFRGALRREGGVAVHFAALLMFVHGRAQEKFDWSQRPFFLRFNTPDRAARESVFRELCAKLGVNAEVYLRS